MNSEVLVMWMGWREALKRKCWSVTIWGYGRAGHLSLGPVWILW
ncbi:MAG: hypothetical protein ABIT01_08020 [Thermoanaerobaculia bacterium]